MLLGKLGCIFESAGGLKHSPMPGPSQTIKSDCRMGAAIPSG